MEILNTYIETVLNPIGTIILIASVVGIFCSLACMVMLGETDHIFWSIVCLILAICLFIFVILILSEAVPFAYDEVTHYEIKINDYYPLSLLQQQFDITEVRGQILDCVENYGESVKVGIGSKFPEPNTVG